MSTNISMRELLEAGVHYGHQCRRWNPKMKPYIFGERNGIHIIDLQKTVKQFKKACAYVEDVTSKGGHILFVGTKRQARDIIVEEATRSNMYFINYRWLGGTLTNHPTIRQSIYKLKKIEKMSKDGTFEKLTKKEVINLEKMREKLELNLGGIKDMPGLPKAIFVVDACKEHTAIAEARKLKIPVIAITDTNSDPTGISHVIPGNDDSYKSLKLFISTVASAAIEGKSKYKAKGNSDEKPQHAQAGTIYDQGGHAVKVETK